MSDSMAEMRYSKFLDKVKDLAELEKSVGDQHVKRIAHNLSEWDTVYSRFEINRKSVDDIKKFTRDPLNQRIEFLRLWRDTIPNANYGALLQICAYTAMTDAAFTIVKIANKEPDHEAVMAQRRLVSFQREINDQSKLKESVRDTIYTSEIAKRLDKWKVNYYYFHLTPSDVLEIEEIQNPLLEKMEVLRRWIATTMGSFGDLLKICAETVMSDCAREIIRVLNTDDTNSTEQDDEPRSNTREQPIKKSDCLEIQSPKGAVPAVNYKSFCERVHYIFSVVNKNEFNAATTVIASPDIEGENKTQLTLYEPGIYLGMIGNHPVGLVQHPPGRRSADMLEKGVKCFPNAKFVVGVGVCYGFDRTKVKFADVLISKQIQDLGDFRITKDGITPRGPIGIMSDEIVAIFGNPDRIEGLQVSSSERRAEHLDGKIASVPILIDYADLKEKIYKAVGTQALGGEMEGGELLNLQLIGVKMPDGSNKRVDVMIIKAVVDYADGFKNKAWQFIGAQAAFNYIKTKMALV